jgi:hypothetical protein
MKVSELSEILPQMHPDSDIAVDERALRRFVTAREKKVRSFVSALAKLRRIEKWDRDWMTTALLARRHVADFVVEANRRPVAKISGTRLTAALQRQYLDLFVEDDSLAAKPPQEKKR